MSANPLEGHLVRLVLPDLERDPDNMKDWERDSEFSRLAEAFPAHIGEKGLHRQMLEDELKTDIWFMIETIKNGKIIGNVDLSDIDGTSGNAWLGISIGDREYWGCGYGTDAMLVLMRYGFEVLNLHRITLNVFEYNQRAIRCYEKVGFKVEGRERQFLNREGRRWDLIFMGILRSEWKTYSQL